MDYNEALRYISGFSDFEKKTGYTYSAETFDLRRPRALLAFMGNPQLRFPSIVVAGTKGKGSTCAMIASILQTSGRRIGLYTQPHLHTFRERIRVEGRLISPREMAEAVEAVIPAVERLERDRPELGPPTTYEVATAAAMYFFARQALDLAVLEVGLGGRLDAVNVVDPLLSVLTPISLDHIQILGNSIAQIAAEKAGIIKENGVVVSAEQPEEAMAVIQQVALERGARLMVVRAAGNGHEAREDGETGRRGDAETPGHGDSELASSPPHGGEGPGAGSVDSTHYSSLITHHFSAHPRQERAEIALRGPSGEVYRTELPLLGAHQVANAATAIAVVEQLGRVGFPVGRAAVEQGLASVQWPGRLEILSRQPLVVVDGAHNGDSAHKLADALRESFIYRRLILILGTSTDKDVPGIIAALAPVASVVIATRSRHARAADPERLAAEARKLCSRVEVAHDLPTALGVATALAAPSDLVCVTGSLFTVADAREQFGLATETDGG